MNDRDIDKCVAAHLLHQNTVEMCAAKIDMIEHLTGWLKDLKEDFPSAGIKIDELLDDLGHSEEIQEMKMHESFIALMQVADLHG